MEIKSYTLSMLGKYPYTYLIGISIFTKHLEGFHISKAYLNGSKKIVYKKGKCFHTIIIIKIIYGNQISYTCHVSDILDLLCPSPRNKTR